MTNVSPTSDRLKDCVVLAEAIVGAYCTICISMTDDGFQAYVEQEGDGDEERETSFRGAGPTIPEAIGQLYAQLSARATDLVQSINSALKDVSGES